MRRRTIRWPGVVLLILMILAPAACRTASETEPMIQVTMDKQVDAADVEFEDGRAIIDVTSPSGIGGMQVALESGDWPAEVVVRLHLSGLERLEIGYDNILIATGKSSNLSPDSALMLYVTNENGEVEQASPSSDVYYPDIQVLTEDGTAATIPLQNGYFEITMPPQFYQTAPEAFTMQWIDFYR